MTLGTLFELSELHFRFSISKREIITPVLTYFLWVLLWGENELMCEGALLILYTTLTCKGLRPSLWKVVF